MKIDNDKVFIADIYSKNTTFDLGKDIFEDYYKKAETHTRQVKKDQVVIKVRDWYVPLFYINNETDLKSIISQEYSKGDLSTYGDKFLGTTVDAPVGYFVRIVSNAFNNEGKQTLQDLKNLQLYYEFENEIVNDN